ncbi:MAG TPA: metal ABC transporter permease [Planctomycetota bacterium]|nr:metal ABC transporter permease [Planctomycetota bacterium]
MIAPPQEEGLLGSLATTLELFLDSFLATLVLATVLAFLGVHVVLRRVVFVGVALAEMASLGIAAAFFAERFAITAPGRPLAFARDHWVMGALMNLVGLAFLLRAERRYLSRESRIAICFTAAGALAVLLVAGSAHGMDEIQVLMTGDPLFVSHQDLNVLFAVMTPAVLLLVVFFRRFLLVAFDPELALTLGVRVRAWEALFYLLLGTAIAMSIHLAGMLFAIGFLVLPAAGALSIARRPWSIFGIAAAIGLGSATAGFLVSHERDWPLGPTTVAVAVLAFLVPQVWRRVSAAVRR